MGITSYGCLFIAILNKSVLKELKILILSKFGNNNWSLKKMLEFFNKELLIKKKFQNLHGQKEQKQNNVSGNN